MTAWIELDCHPRDLEAALKDLGRDNRDARHVVADIKQAAAMIATWPYEDRRDCNPPSGNLAVEACENER